MTKPKRKGHKRFWLLIALAWLLIAAIWLLGIIPEISLFLAQ